jgi:hypothetical protein
MFQGWGDSHRMTPTPNLRVQDRPFRSLGKYHDPAAYMMTFFSKAILGVTEPKRLLAKQQIFGSSDEKVVSDAPVGF